MDTYDDDGLLPPQQWHADAHEVLDDPSPCLETRVSPPQKGVIEADGGVHASPTATLRPGTHPSTTPRRRPLLCIEGPGRLAGLHDGHEPLRAAPGSGLRPTPMET